MIYLAKQGVAQTKLPVMAQKPSQASLRRSYNMESSDDEDTPAVVVFDESAYGIKKKTDSTGAVVKGKPVKAAPIDLDTSNVVPASKKHVMDAEDIADLEVSELWSRLQSSVEDVAASSLSSRDRRKYLQEKTARLSGHAIENPKAPFKILKGMREKEKIRTKRAKEEARISDSVVAVKHGSIAVGTKTKRAKRAKRH